ncbi:MAG: DNA primase [Burkholderiaceae bacterium]
MIPQAFIDTLLQRVDIVELVGSYVQLKKAGINYSGLCPFHTEKSPSFTVSASKQFYHCFGCGAHGTAVGFLMEHLGLSFPQAVEDLARRAGLEVPQEQASENDKAASAAHRDQRVRLMDCTLQAAKFYQRRLKESPQAIDYLKRRGVSGEIAKRYHLGYSPEGWQPLQSVFADYEQVDLVDAGLVIASDDESGKSKRYDRFRNRLMFPILSARGEVIGFGARTLGSDEPKYLNSPETPLFSKGQNLYGVFEGRTAIREAGQVWVVEGYMDVVALAQHGLGHAVATLGTATTEQHLRMLIRMADQVVFMFDGDAAGQRAAAKALEISLPFATPKTTFKFVFLPNKHDPDSFVRESGAQALLDHVAAAPPLSSFLWTQSVADQDLATPEGRAAASVEVRRLLALMPATELKLQIAQACAKRLECDLVSLGVSPPVSRSAAPVRSDRSGRGDFASRSSTHANRPNYRSGDRLSEGRPAAVPGYGQRERMERRPVRRPIPSLADRLMQILVRQPHRVDSLSSEVLATLAPDQQALVQWVRRQPGRQFASLHEAALAAAGDRDRSGWSGDEPGHYEPGLAPAALFQRYAQPEITLDDLVAQDQSEMVQNEWDRAASGLLLRDLQARATSLAKSLGASQTASPERLSELRDLQAKIAELKQSLMQ